MNGTEFDWKSYEQQFAATEAEARDEATNHFWLLDRLTVEDVFDLFEPAVEPTVEE